MDKDMQAQQMTLDGRTCWLWTPYGAPSGTDVVYMVAEDDGAAQVEAILTALAPDLAAGTVAPFVLAAFASGDWNRDFSPWPAPALSGKEEPFSGGAQETLRWLTGTLMPYVEANAPAAKAPAARTLLGYSLGGLFALWACCESEAFLRCGSCSGSLWYDGFLPYIEEHSPPDGSRVYLSLGDKEGKARNLRMASVAQRTEETLALLTANPSVADCTLQWQPGGHFTGVNDRLADALRWLRQK